jgi:serine/threonine-protein kinase HipA
VQPAFDARQIQKKSFRLAMSVGDKRHYVMDTIAPRHFEQDGDAAGLPAGSVDTIIEKLLDAATGVLERAVKSEPTVPALAKSIVAGVQARLRLIEIALNAKTRARRSSSKIEKGEEK